MAEVAITDAYTSEGKRMRDVLDELKRLECFIGFQRGEKSNNQVDLCDYAAFNELGTKRSPSRPFMRNSVDLHRDEIDQTLTQMALLILNGATAEQALREVGVYQKSMIQLEITDGSFVPNSESTIERKGSDKPLIDHGIMRESVNYQIGKKGRFGK